MIVDAVVIANGLRDYRITFSGTTGSNLPQIHGAARLDGAGNLDRTLSWTWDNGSRLTAASDPAASYGYTLDNMGRVTTETQNLAGVGLGPRIDLTRTWDKISNRTGLSAKLVSGGTTINDFTNVYSFDNLNRIFQITQSALGGAGAHAVADKRINLSYNGLGQLTFVSRYQNTSGSGPALRSIYGYDNANRLTSLTHRNLETGGGFTNLATYGMAWDAMDRLTSVNSLLDGTSTFQHDLRSQLTSADHAPARPDEAYSLDQNGNQNSSGYTTGPNNQLTASPGFTYLYDREGNRTRRTKTSDGSYQEYSWDHRNRLTRVTGKSSSNAVLWTVDYAYDVFDRLLKRTHDSNGPAAGGVTDQFFAGYDGLDPTLVVDGPNAADLSNRLLWGPGSSDLWGVPSAGNATLYADEQIGAAGPSQPGNVLWPLGGEETGKKRRGRNGDGGRNGDRVCRDKPVWDRE